MTYDYDHDERCRQIIALLTYAGVGPLDASAIAINLGASEDEMREPLRTLLEAGRIVRSNDGRYSGLFSTMPERTDAPKPGLDHPLQRERGRSE